MSCHENVEARAQLVERHQDEIGESAGVQEVAGGRNGQGVDAVGEESCS